MKEKNTELIFWPFYFLCFVKRNFVSDAITIAKWAYCSFKEATPRYPAYLTKPRLNGWVVIVVIIFIAVCIISAIIRIIVTVIIDTMVRMMDDTAAGTAVIHIGVGGADTVVGNGARTGIIVMIEGSSSY